MIWMARHRPLAVAGLTAASLGLGGCIEYRIETTLDAEGSGLRQEKMIVEEFEDEADNDRLRTNFGYLMFATEDFRWDHRQEVQDDDTLQVFVRETRVDDLTAWTDLTGTVHIAGAPFGSSASIGHVALRDVHFRNEVRVESGRVGEGVSFTYRETFYWDNLADALVEYLVQAFADGVAAEYPSVGTGEREELETLVRSAAWFAVGQGLFEASGDEEEELLAALARRTASRAMQVVARRHPEVEDAGFFERLLKHIYDDEDDAFERFIQEELPGVELAINSEIVFRLQMPGRITSSNAHDRERNTLIWEFAPGDALSAPLEIVAESVVEP